MGASKTCQGKYLAGDARKTLTPDSGWRVTVIRPPVILIYPNQTGSGKRRTTSLDALRGGRSSLSDGNFVAHRSISPFLTRLGLAGVLNKTK
ncbi:hypothetical protein [Paraburkholderia sp. BL10I2N1]|uniref:hypothetical protein n=1 Tax=Paraburkholderia sp. BL10I2N1 TaxID=1938796 RepID=UPI001060BF5A|nr:hypothetical protein [Paraburkholderia sp. BL10I2N1]